MNRQNLAVWRGRYIAFFLGLFWILLAGTVQASETQNHLLVEAFELIDSHYLHAHQIHKNTLLQAAANGIQIHCPTCADRKISTVYHLSQRVQYLKGSDSNHILEQGVIAMVQSLHDPYSYFIPASTTARGGIQTGEKSVPFAQGHGQSQKQQETLKIMLLDKVLVLQITDFSDEHLFLKLYSLLLSMKKKPLEGIVLDIRNNPGGLLDQAVKTANLFLSHEIVVQIRDNRGRQQQVIRANRGYCLFPKIPLVVLINEETASSAEILVAALKDNNRALTVGVKTYGKGTIQTLYRLSQGGILSLTTNHFLSPKGSVIDKKGIQPQVHIIDNDEEAQLKEAFVQITAQR